MVIIIIIIIIVIIMVITFRLFFTLLYVTTLKYKPETKLRGVFNNVHWA